MNLSPDSRILTILDKPKHPQSAWKRTLELQKTTSANVDAVAFCWNAMCDNQAVLTAAQRKKLLHALVEERKEWLGELVADRDKVNPRVIWTDDIAGWVHDSIEEEGMPELVVKSVHKSGTLLHSSTDWQLLRTCPAPVLLTQSRRKKTEKNVLATLDLRHTDKLHRHLNCKVLEAAHEMAALNGSKVHVVFAVEISQVLRDLDIVDETVSKAKIIERITPELKRLLKPYDIPKSRIHMPVGKVGQVVGQAARKIKAQCIVLGSHSNRTLRLVGLGSSAERILQRAVCDVLAVHP